VKRLEIIGGDDLPFSTMAGIREASRSRLKQTKFQRANVEPSRRQLRPNTGLQVFSPSGRKYFMKITFAGLAQACGPETDPQTCNAKLHLRFGKIRLFEASNNEYQIPAASAGASTVTSVRVGR